MAYIPQLTAGITAQSASNSALLPAQNTVGTAQTTPAVNYEFLTGTTNGWFDALGYSSVSYTIVTTASTTGTLSFECTNDTTNAPAGFSMQMQDSTATAVSRLTSLNLTASATFQLEGPITARYIRVRVSTAVSAGSVTLSATLRQTPVQASGVSVGILSPLPTGSSTMSGVSLPSSPSTTLGSFQTALSSLTDVSSAAYTTTTILNGNSTSGIMTGVSLGIAVTAVSGTSPTLDIALRESIDANTYTDFYHFDRITATGVYYTPVIRYNGTPASVRYALTIGGTSPSFTLAIFRTTRSLPGSILHPYFDRTLNATQALNSTTGSYSVVGSTQVQMFIPSTNTPTTLSAFQLQGSDDNSNWYNIGAVLTTQNSATAATSLLAHSARWVRALCTTAGSGQTLAYIGFTAL